MDSSFFSGVRGFIRDYPSALYESSLIGLAHPELGPSNTWWPLAWWTAVWSLCVPDFCRIDDCQFLLWRMVGHWSQLRVRHSGGETRLQPVPAPAFSFPLGLASFYPGSFRLAWANIDPFLPPRALPCQHPLHLRSRGFRLCHAPALPAYLARHAPESCGTQASALILPQAGGQWLRPLSSSCSSYPGNRPVVGHGSVCSACCFPAWSAASLAAAEHSGCLHPGRYWAQPSPCYTAIEPAFRDSTFVLAPFIKKKGIFFFPLWENLEPRIRVNKHLNSVTQNVQLFCLSLRSCGSVCMHANNTVTCLGLHLRILTVAFKF